MIIMTPFYLDIYFEKLQFEKFGLVLYKVLYEEGSAPRFNPLPFCRTF